MYGNFDVKDIFPTADTAFSPPGTVTVAHSGQPVVAYMVKLELTPYQMRPMGKEYHWWARWYLGPVVELFLQTATMESGILPCLLIDAFTLTALDEDNPESPHRDRPLDFKLGYVQGVAEAYVCSRQEDLRNTAYDILKETGRR